MATEVGVRAGNEVGVPGGTGGKEVDVVTTVNVGNGVNVAVGGIGISVWVGRLVRVGSGDVTVASGGWMFHVCRLTAFSRGG